MRPSLLGADSFPLARRALAWMRERTGERVGPTSLALRLWLARQEANLVLEECAWLALDLWPKSNPDGRLAFEERRARFLSPPRPGASHREEVLYRDLPSNLTLLALPADLNDEALAKEVNRKRFHRMVADAWKLEVRRAENVANLVRLARMRGLMTWCKSVDADSILFVGGAARGHSRNYVHGRAMCSIASLALSQGRATLRIWTDGTSKEPYIVTADDPIAFRGKPIERYDSELERTFARWLEGHASGIWALERETSALEVDGVTFLPDFTLSRRADGRTVHVEIVGFWTEDYLARKVRYARAFEDSPLVFLLDRKSLPNTPGVARLLREKSVFLGDLGASPSPFFAWLETFLSSRPQGTRKGSGL